MFLLSSSLLLWMAISLSSSTTTFFSPENSLVTNNTIKIVDFGLAREVSSKPLILTTFLHAGDAHSLQVEKILFKEKSEYQQELVFKAGIGIAELIALEMSKQTKAPLQEIRKKIWLVDSMGLIVSSRKESLQHFKKPWAHDHEPVKTLLDAVKVIKPTILIGTSGVGQTFTKEVVEAMASFNEMVFYKAALEGGLLF